MPDRIVVESSELQTCAREYRQAQDVIEQAVREYADALNALRSDWSGDAFEIMHAHVEDLKEKITASIERVNDAIKELGDVEVLFAENENKIKTRATNQDVGTKSRFIG